MVAPVTCMDRLMEAEEINGLVWDILAESGKPMDANDLVLETGQPLLAIQSCLARLRKSGLLRVEGQPPHATYQVDLDLDSLRWAQAVSMGVGLLSLERHARLSASAKNRALQMTTDGSLDEIEERERQKKKKQRDEAIRGRAASRAAASDLALLLEDTTAALSSAQNMDEKSGRAVASLLKQANAEAKKALDGLVKSLSGQ